MIHGRMAATALAVSILLTGCGGGGGGSSSDNGGSTPIAPGNGNGGDTVTPPGGNGATAYNGATGDAMLTESSLGRFLPLVLSSSELLAPTLLQAGNPLQSGRSSVDEKLYCDSGSGQMTGNINDDDGTGTITAILTNCEIDDVVMDGSYSVRFDRWDMNALVPLDFITTFNAFRTTTANGDYAELTGTVDVSGSNACDMSSIANLSTRARDQKASFLYEDLRTTSKCTEPDWEGDVHLLQTISGKIYIGDLGAITVSSAGYTVDLQGRIPDDYYNDYPVLRDGTISFSNSNGNFTLAAIEHNVEFKPDYVNRLSVDADADGTPEYQLEFPAWYVTSDVLMDFGDDDGDGMWNGWERYYGLNPNRDDADGDIDDDGYLNSGEFKLFMAPNRHNFGGVATFYGGYPGPSVSEDKLVIGVEATLDVPMAINVEPEFENRDLSFDLVIDLTDFSGQWQAESNYDCKLVEGTERQIRCDNMPLAAMSETDQFLTLSYTPDQPIRECLYFNIERDYKIVGGLQPWCLHVMDTPSPMVPTSTSTAFVLDDLQGNAEYRIDFDNYTYEAATAFTIKGTLTNNSAGTTLDAVDTYIIGAPRGNCTLIDEQNFSCSYDHYFTYNGLQLSLTKPSQTGTVQIAFTTQTHYGDNYVAEDSFSRKIAFARPMSELGQYILAAEAGSEPLVLPAEIYAGGLYLSEHRALKGQPGTELWFRTQVDDRHSDNNLSHSYTDTANLEGLTIYAHSNALRLGKKGAIVKNNTFYALGTRVGGMVTVDMSDSAPIEITGNRFILDEATHSHDELYWDDPRQLILLKYGPAGVHSDTVIANNWARDIGRDLSLVKAEFGVPTAKTGEPNLIVANNTLLNVEHLAHAVYPDNLNWLIANNLLYQADGALTEPLLIGNEAPYVNQYDGINFTANLLPAPAAQQAAENLVYPAEFDPGVEGHPVADSPAIDAGLDLSGWITDDIDGNSRPNGTAFDIGAFEYQH